MLKLFKSFFFYILSALIIFAFLFLSFFSQSEIDLNGKTMGTNYNIKILTDNGRTCKKFLQESIDSKLSKISQSLSIYDVSSEISYFNFMIEGAFSPSDNFITLLFISKLLYKISQGVWDPTINSVIGVWGFNSKNLINKVSYIFNLPFMLDKVDFGEGISLDINGSLLKKFGSISIDFSSIAKGFGVDQLVSLLKAKGFDNFLVEIGGEVYVSGKGKGDKKWRVGIYYPDKFFLSNQIYKVLLLTDKAIATSGNYRNFVKLGINDLPHIVNPITGNPVSNSISSVSVIAENCTLADALATILMLVMPRDGIYLVNSFENTECIITFVNKKGIVKNYLSDGLL